MVKVGDKQDGTNDEVLTDATLQYPDAAKDDTGYTLDIPYATQTMVQFLYQGQDYMLVLLANGERNPGTDPTPSVPQPGDIIITSGSWPSPTV